MFTVQDIQELRARTGAGMMDCKKALQENDGNMEKAIEYLREKGMAAVAKKSGRIAAEGAIFSYIHFGGRIGVLLEVNCETDFVAREENFQQFGKDIAMQIAANNPLYVSKNDVPASEIEKEKAIQRAACLNEGKPEAIVDKIVEGKIAKYLDEVCLLNQSFIKNPDITIEQYLNEMTLKTGEKLSIRRFVRYELGEGLEKRQDNFVEEVMNSLNKQ